MTSLLAAVTHDLDHPGVNQPFLIATSNHLAALYKVILSSTCIRLPSVYLANIDVVVITELIRAGKSPLEKCLVLLEPVWNVKPPRQNSLVCNVLIIVILIAFFMSMIVLHDLNGDHYLHSREEITFQIRSLILATDITRQHEFLMRFQVSLHIFI